MVLILLLSTMVKAYNKTNRIVLYYDEITIYPTGDKDNPVEHHYMLPFPQPYKNEQNTVEEGNYLCWAGDYVQYIDECYNTPQGLESNFVVIILYTSSNSKDITYFLGNITEGEEGTSQIKGLIIASDMTVTETDVPFYDPPIISEIMVSDAVSFQPYCFNAEIEGQDPTAYLVDMEHVFVNNCFVLTSITPTYFAFAAIWGVIGAIFLIWLYLMPHYSRLNIQKSVFLLFPGFKILELILQGLWLFYCPWITMSSS